MKKEIIVSAKSVEEAVAKAVLELGAPSEDKIEYTVLEDAKKGFLGIGASDAKISATYTVGGEENAFEFVKTLLENMSIDAEVTMTDGEAGEKRITVSGESAAILIGHHGETLDSLQYLASLAANKKVDGKKEDYVRITVDVEGYRAKREETLRALARRMAARVQKYKKSVMLEPMNPYERRIIHSEIQNIAGVSTNSIGSENNRKIVIFLDGDAE
ncbi:MAG: Jag N-terminal domain-containing protein [Clostridia bacterium]|nr:Jag N-terminal domain-containing protein [Clostridia bacterium]MBQ2385265.1 Jag N-terminal domain-containing protein [Clostridia bacterium]MBQ5633426.1 Jag N-terminal domain-containing protein [Clostridia bacterium]MBR0454266.1 Jag N-terminal domain-containing protein [Clostridia bacterium]